MIRRILVDFDGTFADSLDLIYDLSVRCSRRYGVRPLEPDEFHRLRAVSMRERVRRMRVPRWKMPLFMSRFFRLYKEHVNSVKPFPGVIEAFEDIRARGISLSVLSSNRGNIIRKFLATHGITVFDDVYGSAGIFGKSRMIRRIIRAERLPEDEVLYIGDEHRDIEACRECGVRIIAVTWGYDARELLVKENPDFLADSPEDIVRIVTSIK